MRRANPGAVLTVGITVSLVLLAASSARAEDLTFTTYYPAPSAAGSSGGVRGPNALIGAGYQTQTPPTNGMLVEGQVGIGTASPSAAKLLISIATPPGTYQNSEGLFAMVTGAGAGGSNIGITGMASGSTSQQNLGGQFIATAEGTNQPATGVFAAAGDNSATQNVSSILGGSFQAQHINTRLLPDMMGVLANVYRGGPGVVTTERGIVVGRGGSGTATNTYGIQINNQQGTATNNYGLYIDTQTGATNNYAIYSLGGQNYFGGNVGIGTTTPGEPLELLRTINEPRGIFVRNSTNGGLAAARLAFGNDNNYADIALTSSGYSGSGMFGYGANTGASTLLIINRANAPIKFRAGGTYNDDSSTRMTITGGGNVGIGTTAPAEKLHVVGNLRVDGAIVGTNPRSRSGTVFTPRDITVTVTFSPAFPVGVTPIVLLTPQSAGTPPFGVLSRSNTEFRCNCQQDATMQWLAFDPNAF